MFEEFERVQKKLAMQDFRHTDMNAYLIRVAIKQLPELLQRRMRMFFFYGFSETEIAGIEGVSQPAVHYSIQSGIRQLRYMLDI